MNGRFRRQSRLQKREVVRYSRLSPRRSIFQTAETAGYHARHAAEQAREGYQRVAEQAREGYNRISDQFDCLDRTS